MTLRELLDAATPGPWEYDEDCVVSHVAAQMVCEEGDTGDSLPLIAVVPEMAALLLEMADALRGAGEDLRWMLDEHPEHMGAYSDGRLDEIGALLARFDRIGQ